VAAILWGVPGGIIAAKGIRAYLSLPVTWWLFAITVVVLLGFYFMFTRIVDRYAARIEALPCHRPSVWQTFPLRGWVLIVCMSALGMALKFVGVPVEFTASFYSGLGPMLLYAAARFVYKNFAKTLA